jgi:hypothetical protein
MFVIINISGEIGLISIAEIRLLRLHQFIYYL